MKKIDTNKIEYRASKASDAHEHFKAVQESYKEASQFLPFFVGMENWTIKQHEDYLRKFGADDKEFKNYLFFYEGEVIGAGHLKKSAWDNSGELLYWVRTGWDGLGIGLFIASTMLKSASANFGYRFIVIETDHNNIGSKRVAEKLGAFVGLIYGYYDHFNKQSNMVVWVIPTPITKVTARFNNSYKFNPISRHMNHYYRFDYEGKVANYIAHDPSLERKKS